MSNNKSKQSLPNNGNGILNPDNIYLNAPFRNDVEVVSQRKHDRLVKNFRKEYDQAIINMIDNKNVIHARDVVSQDLQYNVDPLLTPDGVKAISKFTVDNVSYESEYWPANLVNKDIAGTDIKFYGPILLGMYNLFRDSCPSDYFDNPAQHEAWTKELDDVIELNFTNQLGDETDPLLLTRLFKLIIAETYSAAFQTYYDDNTSGGVNPRPFFDTDAPVMPAGAIKFTDFETNFKLLIINRMYHVIRTRLIPGRSDKYVLTTDAYLRLTFEVKNSVAQTSMLALKPVVTIIATNDETIKSFAKNTIMTIKMKNQYNVPVMYYQSTGYVDDFIFLKYSCTPKLEFSYETLSGNTGTIKLFDIGDAPTDKLFIAQNANGNKVTGVDFDSKLQRITWRGSKKNDAFNLHWSLANIVFTGDQEHTENFTQMVKDTISGGSSPDGVPIPDYVRYKLEIGKGSRLVGTLISTPVIDFGNIERNDSSTDHGISAYSALSQRNQSSALFKNISALSPDGQFIFSMNMIPKFKDNWFESKSDIDSLSVFDSVYVLGNKI